MIHPGLAENPLRTRGDLQRACADLLAPLDPSRSMWGRIALRIGGFSPREGGGRPCDELTRALTPEAEDAGLPALAPIGLGLALRPDLFWDPLDDATKRRLEERLGAFHPTPPGAGDHLLLRPIVNLGLRRVGSKRVDAQADRDALERLETHYAGDGWYGAGPAGHPGLFEPSRSIPFHVHALVYARLAGDRDPTRARLYRERAGLFAAQVRHWFADDGAPIPYGRSPASGFAAAAFWSALVFAGEEARPWGEIKGLLRRHLRWRLQRPRHEGSGRADAEITEPDDVSLVSYDPLRCMLCLAVPEDHPFWTSEEAPALNTPGPRLQRHPRMILCDAAASGHLHALSAGQWPADPEPRDAEAYERLAYSAVFDAPVQLAPDDRTAPSVDSMLLLRDGEERWRAKRGAFGHVVDEAFLSARWKPWSDVDVQTWLVPFPPWHLRVHRIRSARALESLEGGFALPRTDTGEHEDLSSGASVAWGDGGLSGVVDGAGRRAGGTHVDLPGARRRHVWTLVPVLRGTHEAGETWLASLVVAHPDAEQGMARWNRPPPPARIADTLPNEMAAALAKALV